MHWECDVCGAAIKKPKTVKEEAPFKEKSSNITENLKRSSNFVNNTITLVPTEKAVQQKLQKIYEWACMLTTEQKEDSRNYYWTPEAKALLRRLENSSGNMIAVLGLQGSGKTALRQALEFQLVNRDYTVLSLKWVGDMHQTMWGKIQRMDQGESEYLDELMEALYNEESSKTWEKGLSSGVNVNDVAKKIARRLGLTNSEPILRYLKARYSRRAEETSSADLLMLLPLIEKSLGRAKIEQIRTQILMDRLQTAHTILIDMPDYDRNNSKEMHNDLTKLQFWWENVFTDQLEGYTQHVNLVLFFQKELFHGHFFFGKLDVYELKPLTPDQLLECYRSLFNDFYPFTEDALREIAILSRGVFRRFKKYIRICLDQAFLSNSNTITEITREKVNEWITLEQVVKDMELEMMTIFPKERENRVLSVKVLRLLREKGSLPQSKIAAEIFDGASMRASRVLDRLESWGYIRRERSGKEKIVSLI